MHASSPRVPLAAWTSTASPSGHLSRQPSHHHLNWPSAPVRRPPPLLPLVARQAEHGDLAGLIKAAAKDGAPLGLEAVWRTFTQVADALAYMHERRVMHRDSTRTAGAR